MSKYIFTIFLIFATIAFAASNTSSGGKAPWDYYIHNTNNYWQTVYETMISGYKGEDGPAGIYPAGSTVGNLYYSTVWIGMDIEMEDEWFVIAPEQYDSPELVALDEFHSTTSSWPGFPTYGDFDTTTLCDDSNAAEFAPYPILVRGQTWSFTNSNLDDCIGYKFIIQNMRDSWGDVSEVYVGFYADFDVNIDDADDDFVGTDESLELVYLYDSDSSCPGYYGVTCGVGGDWYDPGVTIWNVEQDEDNDYHNLLRMQNRGWQGETSVPEDYRVLLTVKFDPDDFDYQDIIVAGFYEVAGATLEELKANAEAARNSYINDDPPLGVKNIKSASLGEIKATFK